MLLEKGTEMGRLYEAQHVAYFGYLPVRVLEQGVSFAHEALGDKLSGSLAGHFFQSSVKVVDVHGQL